MTKAPQYIYDHTARPHIERNTTHSDYNFFLHERAMEMFRLQYLLNQITYENVEEEIVQYAENPRFHNEFSNWLERFFIVFQN